VVTTLSADGPEASHVIQGRSTDGLGALLVTADHMTYHTA
jgi:hypothetical protein